MTNKSTMLKKMIEIIMLIMVNSLINLNDGVIYVVHPNLVMVASTFHVGIDLSNKIK